MDIQRHSSVLGDTVEKLSDEASYKQLFHAYRDEEALPSGEVLKEIIDLCRAILFPGYYGNARISKQTIRFHTGVNVETLHSLLSKQVYARLARKKRSPLRQRLFRRLSSLRFRRFAVCWLRMWRRLSMAIPPLKI